MSNVSMMLRASRKTAWKQHQYSVPTLFSKNKRLEETLNVMQFNVDKLKIEGSGRIRALMRFKKCAIIIINVLCVLVIVLLTMNKNFIQ